MDAGGLDDFSYIGVAGRAPIFPKEDGIGARTRCVSPPEETKGVTRAGCASWAAGIESERMSPPIFIFASARLAFLLYQHSPMMRLPTRSKKTKTPTAIPTTIPVLKAGGEPGLPALIYEAELEEIGVVGDDERRLDGVAVAGGRLVVKPAIGTY